MWCKGRVFRRTRQGANFTVVFIGAIGHGKLCIVGQALGNIAPMQQPIIGNRVGDALLYRVHGSIPPAAGNQIQQKGVRLDVGTVDKPVIIRTMDQHNGVILRAADKNQRLEEVLPDPVEREDGRRNDSGLNNGHQNFEQDTDFGAAIDHGRFIQLFGDAAHVLHDQKDEERTAECPRQDHGQQRIVEVELFQDNVLRNDHDLCGDHHGHDDAAKPEVGTEELDAGYRIGCQQEGENRADNADDRNDGRVHKEMPETVPRRAGKAGIVVFDDAPAFRQQGIGVLEHRIIGFE